MSYSLTVEEKAGYLHIRVSGENSAVTLRADLREVYETSARMGVPSVLIEEDLHGPILSSVDVYRVVSEASAETSPIILHIAYVDVNPEHPSSSVDLGVAVARDRGVNVQSFRSLSDAEEWLAEPRQATDR
jgi:hypothetical protein